jgi:GNAT superfamily N-acetyltransferase
MDIARSVRRRKGAAEKLDTQEPNVVFGVAEPEDAADMVAFHNSYYGSQRTADHWRWEYDSYMRGTSKFTYVKVDDRLVGTTAVQPVYMNVGGRRVLSARSENALLLPEYRGTGLMPALYDYMFGKCRDRGMQIWWGFTPALGAARTIGVSCHSDIQVWERPGRVHCEAHRRLVTEGPYWRRVGSAARSVVRGVSFHMRGRRTHCVQEREGYQVRRGTCEGRSMRGLHERARKPYPDVVRLEFDDEYLRWRVRENPFLAYSEYEVRQSEELRAYALVVLSRKVASISDLFSEDSHATSLLIQAILDDFGDRAGVFRYLGNRMDAQAQDVHRQLEGFGFTPNESTSRIWNLVVKDLSGGEYPEIHDIRNWHVAALWTEGFLY